MAMNDTRTYDFSDVTARIGQKTFTLLGIKYKLNRTMGKGRDNAPKKRYRTRGYIDPDGELTIYLHDRDDFLEFLESESPTGAFLDAEFDVTATYGTDNQPTLTDVLEGCQVMDIDLSAEPGEDPLEITIPVDIMDIVLSGRRGFNDPSAA